METKDNKQWHLIRNDNGEWISDEYIVFVSELEALALQIEAARQRKPLAIQHGQEGSLWCYKHEVEAIDLTPQEKDNKPRNLIIKKQ
jgi:hypothetical protein